MKHPTRSTRTAALEVVFDDQIFSLPSWGGAARYFAELIRALPESPQPGVRPVLPFRYVASPQLRELDHRLHQPPAFARRPRIVRRLNRGAIRRAAAGRILHHTYYYEAGLDVPAAARICTVLDMTPELFPQYFPAGNPHAAKDRYVATADAVLCISESTKADVLRHYGGLDKPVVVTPLGVDERFFVRAVPDNADRPYVLFVGMRGWYKNFDVVLRAFARLAAEAPELDLVCVGAAFDADEQARIAELGLTQRVRRADVTEAGLPALYAGANCLAFPSRYEGFGLPIVEAFAAGCPVVLAEMPCAIEVGGDAAQFFSPDDDEALAEIIARLATDERQRASWIDAGRRRATEFSWRRTAALTAEAYREVASRAG